MINSDPLTKITYPISSSKSLNLFLENGLLQASFLGTQDPFLESKISIYLPFDITTLLTKLSNDEVLTLLVSNFHPTPYKDSYLLTPKLLGGGGAPSKTKNTNKVNRPQNDQMTSNNVSRQTIEEKRSDIRNNFFFEQDQYPRSYSNSNSQTQVGPFYEEIIKVAFDELEKTEKEKFDLSIKNFRRFFKEKADVQERKLLELKLKAKYSEKFETVLGFLLKILKEEIYLKDNKEQQANNVNQEVMKGYERKILGRLISNSIFSHFKTDKLEENPTLFEPLMNCLIKLGKFFLKTDNSFKTSPMSKFSLLLEFPKKKQSNKKKETTFETFRSYIEENYKKWLELPCAKAYEEIQLFTLRKISFKKYSTHLLVKYYNLSKKSEEPIDKINRKLIENLSLKILEIYQEREDTMTSAELMELVTLAGIKQEGVDSSEKTISQRLMGMLCNDINNDIIFDSFKVQCLAAIIFQNSPTDSKTSGRLDDDLKQCLNVIHKQVEHRLFTSENQNMQDAMDALNIVLQIMAARSVKGLRNAKEKTDLLNTFKDQMPSATKQVFQTVTGATSDPSLKIKAKYAQEAIKKIGDEDNALSDTENAILALAPAVYSIAKGIFTMDTDAIEEGLSTIASTAIDIYVNLERDWFEEVNKVLFLSNTDFETFEKRYFSTSTLGGVKSEEVAFYIAKQLYLIAKTCERSYADRMKAIELLGDVYEGRNSQGQKLRFFYFSVSSLKKEIKVYIHKCLSDLSRIPKEEQYPFYTSLGDVVLKVIKRLGLATMEIETKFEFNPAKPSLGNSLFINALKQKMLIDYSLGVLQSESEEQYKKEIKDIDYIEIEGIQYLSKAKTSKRLPLWSKYAENAFDEFLKNPEYTVMLIQGDAGTGKSVLLKMIEYQQWKRFKLGVNDYIPIYIRLAEVNNAAKCIQEALQSMHSSSELIEAMKAEKNNRKYLFIFDGYDELKAPKNLFESNKLLDYGSKVKVIITSREEYLKAYGEYSKYFKATHQSVLLEYRITPLSADQRNHYIQRRVEREQKTNVLDVVVSKAKKLILEWDLNRYLKTIKEIHGLEELLKTPYMLKIIVDILPSLGSEYKKNVTKSNIYKVFTMKHFETEMNRLLHHSQEQIPKGFDLEKSFYEYSKDLAINMFMLDKTSVITEGYSYSLKKQDLHQLFSKPNNDPAEDKLQNFKESDPFSRFFSNDPVTKLARSGAQLIIFNGQARFTHKSIMEYYTARFFYDEFKFTSIENLPKSPLSLKLIYGGGQTNQESDVITFLKQMIDDNEEKQNALKGSYFASIEEDKWRRLARYQTLDGVSDEDLESEQDTHILRKIRKLMIKRTTAQFPDIFYKNLLILTLFCAKYQLIDFLSFSEATSLESQVDLPKDMRTELARKLAMSYCFGNGTGKDLNQCSFFSNKYYSLHLEGVYKGETILDGKKRIYLLSGKGEMKYDNGNFYNGDWEYSKKQGFGIMTFDKNNIFVRYEGFFNDDKFEGTGILEYSNKSFYFGKWILGEATGFGKKSFYKQCPKKLAIRKKKKKGKNKNDDIIQRNKKYLESKKRPSEKTPNETKTDDPLLFKIYEGNWLKGGRDGNGVISFNWRFPKLSFYKRFHGSWQSDIIQSGSMEFRDGRRIEGYYSEETDMFFSSVRFRDYHFEGILTTPIHESIYQSQSVAMFDIVKIPNIDELMKVDSFGNSLLVLLLKKSNVNLFNNLTSNLIDVLYKQKQYPLLPNNEGDNFLHVICSNINIDIETKIQVIKDLNSIKAFAPIIRKTLTSVNKAKNLPVMIAIKMMEKDKKTPPQKKIELIHALTPSVQKQVSAYWGEEFSKILVELIPGLLMQKKSQDISKYLLEKVTHIVCSKTTEEILDENHLGSGSIVQEILKIKEFWCQKCFHVLLFKTDLDFLSQFNLDAYFLNNNELKFNLFHFKITCLFFLKLMEKDPAKNLREEFSANKGLKYLLEKSNQFLVSLFSKKNSQKIHHYLKMFIVEENTDIPIFNNASYLTLGLNEEELKRFFISLLSKIFKNEASHFKQIFELITDYYANQNDFFLQLIKMHSLPSPEMQVKRGETQGARRRNLELIIFDFVNLKFEIHMKSHKETNYFNFLFLILTTYRKLLMNSIGNLLSFLQRFLSKSCQEHITPEGEFDLIKIMEFSFVNQYFNDKELEKLLNFFLETYKFLPQEAIFEKLISTLIIKGNHKSTLVLLNQFKGRYSRIQSWHIEFFQYHKFFLSPEEAAKEFSNLIPEIRHREYIKIKEKDYEMLENVNILQKNIPTHRFLKGVKYFVKNEKKKTIGFFVKHKQIVPEVFHQVSSCNNLKGMFKFDERRTALIEDDNLTVLLFSEKMKEVLKFLITHKIFVKDLNVKLLDLSPKLLLELYFEQKFLLIDKQECLKNFSEQGKYHVIPDYCSIFNDFLFDRLKKCFIENRSLAEGFFKDNGILDILRNFFVPSLENNKFLNIFVHKLFHKLSVINFAKSAIKILKFLFEFLESMKTFVPEKKYPDFFSDFFFLVEMKFYNAVFFKKIKVLTEKIQKIFDVEIYNENSSKLSNATTKCEEKLKESESFFDKGKQIEIKKIEAASKMHNFHIYNSDSLQEFEKSKNQLLGFPDSFFNEFFVNKIGCQNLFLKVVFSSESTIKNAKEVKKILENFSIKACAPEFLENIKKEHETFVSKYRNNEFSIFIDRWLKAETEFLKLPATDEIFADFLKLEQNFKNIREDLILSSNASNDEFLSLYKLTSVNKYLEVLKEKNSKIPEELVIPKIKISKHEVVHCFPMLMEFFFKSVFSHFKIQEKAKRKLYISQIFDHWLLDNHFYSSMSCLILAENLLKTQINLEEITTNSNLLYENLLFCCLKNNYIEVSLNILKNFGTKISVLRLNSLKKEECEAQKMENSDENEVSQEKNNEDQGDEGKEIASKPIFIQNEEILQVLKDLNVDYETHKEHTLKEWCLKKPLEKLAKLADIFPLEWSEINGKNIKCNLQNWFWLILKKFENSKENSVDFLLLEQEGVYFLFHLIKTFQNSEQDMSMIIGFIMETKADEIFEKCLEISDITKREWVVFQMKSIKFLFEKYSQNKDVLQKISKSLNYYLKNNSQMRIYEIEWLMFFLKNPEILANFDELYNYLLIKFKNEHESMFAKLIKEDLESSALIYNWFLFKNFLILYLKGNLSEKQILNSLSTFYGEYYANLVLVSSNLSFLEIMIYNLLKTKLLFWVGKKETKLHLQEVLKGKPFFEVILSFLGYAILPKSGVFNLKKFSDVQIIRPCELLSFKKELMELSEISNNLPKASTYKSQLKFMEESGIIIPESSDIFGVFIFIIDFVFQVLSIDDLERRHLNSPIPKVFDCAVKFEKSSGDKNSLIEYQPAKKLLVFQYNWEKTESAKNLNIFKVNTENFWEVKSILEKENSMLFNDTFNLSMEILQNWYFDTELTEEQIKSSMTQLSPICKLFMNSKDALIIEVIIYNALINFLICVVNEKDRKAFSEKTENFLKIYNGNCPFFIDILLQTFGFSRVDSQEISSLKLKKSNTSLDSIISLKRFRKKMDIFLDSFFGKRKKSVKIINSSKDSKYLQESLKIELPKNMSEISLVSNLIDFTINVISLFDEIHNYIGKNNNIKGDNIVLKFELFKDGALPKTFYSNSNGNHQLAIYYRFEKKKRYLITFSQNDFKELKQKISRTNEEKN